MALTLMDIIKIKHRSYLRPTMIFIIYIALAFFAGLRSEIGLDYSSYKEIYNDVPTVSSLIFGTANFADIHGEYGYLLINVLVKSLFDDFSAVILFMSFFGLSFIVYSCYKYTPFVFLSVYLYVTRVFFVRDMGQIRSAVACAIILYSIDAVQKRKFLHFFLLISLAALFHSAAWFAFPIYFICKNKISNRIYFYFLFISISIGTLVPMKELILSYFGFNEGLLIHYALSEYGESLGILNPIAVMQVFLLLLFVIYRKKIEPKIYGYNIMLNMYAFSTYWLITFNELGIIAARLSTMLSTVEILIIPSLLLIVNNKILKTIIYVAILVLGIILLYSKAVQNDLYQLYIPYKSLF